MTRKCDLLILNGTLITDKEFCKANIAVTENKIVDIGDCTKFTARQSFNASNLHILPGIIDGHVHFRDPGALHKEDLISGSKSALLGGITTICDMPNTNPPTTSKTALIGKLRTANENLYVDYGFWLGATGNNSKEILSLQNNVGVAGIKLYMSETTGNLIHEGKSGIIQLLQQSPRPVAFHAENQALLDSRKLEYRTNDVASHSVWRNSTVAAASVLEIAKLCKNINGKANILHLSSDKELEVIKKYRNFLYCEVTPQHLTLSSPNCYNRIGTLAQMNPPLRSDKNISALWKGIKDGLIDTIGSDHAPHTIKEKSVSYPDSPSGMPGTQTMLSLMLNGFTNNQIPLTKLVSMMSTKVASILKLEDRGKIEKNKLANLTIVDLKHKYKIVSSKLNYKCGWTPYEGVEVQGKAVVSIIQGKIVMHHDELLGIKGNGKPIR